MTPSSARQRLLGPFNLAAYATLGAVALALARLPGGSVVLDGIPARGAAFLALAAFFVGFLLATTAGERRVMPIVSVGLGLMLAGALAMVLLIRAELTPVLLVIVASVASMRLTVRSALALLVAANLILLLILMRRVALSDAAVMIAIYGGFQAFAALASHAYRRANETAAALQEVNAELLANRSLLAESARDGERLRLSRELHDVSGHKLTALKLNLALLAQDNALAVRHEFAAIRSLTDELLTDLRGVVSQLRRHDGIELSEALARLANVMPTLRVIVDCQPEARIDDAERGEALLRIAQEALTNAARHSGARNVAVSLTRSGESLRLTIEDDGRAPRPLPAGHGIEGMHERAQLLGGTLTTEPAASGGLRVCVTLPRARVT